MQQRWLIAAAALVCPVWVHADLTAVGYYRLAAELGAAMPTGAGIHVDQIEGGATYRPDANNPQFSGKTFTWHPADITGNSTHATTVGQLFYGNTGSMSPGIIRIKSYGTDPWLSGPSSVLRVAQGVAPTVSQHDSGVYSRIANHSWVGTYGTNLNSAGMTYTAEALRRLDWLVHNDDHFQVVGLPNHDTANGASLFLLGGSFNAITVGRTDGGHLSAYTSNIDNLYTANRVRPTIVAPQGATSYATPMVSSAIALLLQAASANPSFSAGSYVSPRTGEVIYHAATTEVVKAALMAGADRYAIPTWRTASRQSNNGLDTHYGAGELDIYNSYRILAAGAQNSRQDGRLVDIAMTGFDYDPQFGGGSDSNSTGTYTFTPASVSLFSASLVWNMHISTTGTTWHAPTATLYNLDLRLLDVTDPLNPLTLADSNSTNENTENVRLIVRPGRDYRMEVYRGAGQGNFVWDYGLAWHSILNPQALVAASGDWHAGDTWATGIRPDADVEGVIASGRTVNITAATGGVAAPRLFIGDNSTTGTLTQSGGALTVAGLVQFGSAGGSVSVSGGAMNLGGISGRGAISVSGGSLSSAGGIDLTSSSSVNVIGGTLSASHIRAASLNIASGGKVALHNGGPASIVSTLTVGGMPGAWTGTLDLSDNDLLVRATAGTRGTALQTLTSLVASGRNSGPGLWQGMGIQSSAAAMNSHYGIAVMLNDRGDGTPLLSTLDGQLVGLHDVLAMYAIHGDVDLNGMINGDDFFHADLGFLTQSGGWRGGDFNYDGVTDARDFFLIDQAYLAQAAGALASVPSAAAAVVPEPGVLLGLGLSTLILLRRRW